MIIVQASNIHQGGGAVLLTELLRFLEEDYSDSIVFVDSRYNVAGKGKLKIVKIKASIVSRFKVEFLLRRIANKNSNSTVLFFGNLPPLFKSTSKAVLFFQNTVLLNNSDRKFRFGLKTSLRLEIEKIWLKVGLKYIKTVYVQSESIRNLFLSNFPDQKVKVLAFSGALPEGLSSDLSSRAEHDFVYVASAEPHKNHINLIRAWIFLSEQGVWPKLTLTASNFKGQLRSVFESALEKGVRIEVLPELSHKELLKVYCSSKALIYPSFTESFGLPLIEAARAGLPILAGELDFVRDLVTPAQSFDPNSALSIARAVQRFLGKEESAKTNVRSAEEFIREIGPNKSF